MLIAGPNLAIDRTVHVDALRPGQVLRVRQAVGSPGGKGANVARAAHDLGHRATLVGFLPGPGGEEAARRLAEEGIDVAGVPVAGDLRQATVIVEDGGRTTVLNEPGPVLASGDADRLLTLLEARASGHGVVVGTGSLPPGIDAGFYGVLTEWAHKNGATVVLDTTGAVLLAALAAGPDVVTPNLVEAEGALAGRIGDEPTGLLAEVRARALDAGTALVARGARAALVTAGRFGLGVVTASGARWLDAHPVEVVNTVGAGDALVAGVVSGLEDGGSLEAAAAWGVAVAAAAVAHPDAGRLHLAHAHDLAQSRSGDA